MMMFPLPPPGDEPWNNRHKKKPRLRMARKKRRKRPPKPKARPIPLGMGFPASVLCDMARSLVRGIDADYFELVPTLDDDCNWLKRTLTHSYLLIGYWWICTNCDHAERNCCCDGLHGDKDA